MLCRYCKKKCTDNFVRRGDFVAHIPCLAQARDKQTQAKAIATSYKECTECHGNCNGNYVTYKGYWFHELCLFERIRQTLGVDMATTICSSL